MANKALFRTRISNNQQLCCCGGSGLCRSDRRIAGCHTPGDICKRVHRFHDDVIKWKHFPRYWPFARGIHRSPVNSPHKGQWRGALMFSLIWTRIIGCVNYDEAGDLRRCRALYDVIVMYHVILANSYYYWWFISAWLLRLSLGCLCPWLFLLNHGLRLSKKN